MESQSTKEVMFVVNNLWIIIATALVFIMHLGFTLLEAGLTRSKNTINILYKNLIIMGIGVLSYMIIGFNLMYPNFLPTELGIFKLSGLGLAMPANGLTSDYSGAYTYWSFFLFQAMFAAATASIISGAVAERIKENSYFLFALLFISFCYPIIGSWGWGGGWLSRLGFHDFAGCAFVHTVGGTGALIAVWQLGARIGKFEDGKVMPIPGHNMPLLMIGVFLLWMGWFGFNGGSVLSADPAKVSQVLVMTTLSACAGLIVADWVAYSITKTHDLTMALNGALAGLVGITASCDITTPMQACMIGGIGGAIVVGGVIFFDKVRLDDPVGALSVHLLCGSWGVLAVGLFGEKAGIHQFLVQLEGLAAVFFTTAIFAFVVLFAIKKTIGLRAKKEDELMGMDEADHGMTAYPNFIVNPSDGTNM